MKIGEWSDNLKMQRTKLQIAREKAWEKIDENWRDSIPPEAAFAAGFEAAWNLKEDEMNSYFASRKITPADERS